MTRIFGLLVPINQLQPGPEAPFDLDVEGLEVVRVGAGWGVLWTLREDGMEFGISVSWALGAGTEISMKHIIPNGFQSGEYQVVMFELDDGEEIDTEVLVERFDWTSDVRPP